MQLDRRMPHVERLHEGWQQIRGNGRARPDAQRALSQPPQRVHSILRGALLGQYRPRVPKQHGSCLRKPHARRNPLHQPRAGLPLQLSNAFRDAGLRQSQLLGRPGKTLPVRDRHEHAKQLQAEWHN